MSTNRLAQQSVAGHLKQGPKSHGHFFFQQAVAYKHVLILIHSRRIITQANNLIKLILHQKLSYIIDFQEDRVFKYKRKKIKLTILRQTTTTKEKNQAFSTKTGKLSPKT